LPEILTDPDRPEPESPGTRRSVQALAVLALTVGVAYLAWRTLFTLNLSVWWLSVPLLLLEAHAVAGLALFAFSLWDVDAVPPAPRCEVAPGRVAVLIPTYSESADILLPTIAAAAALRPAHETWVLDDGDRPEIRRLAHELGVEYLARRDRTGAKAGNINHALTVVDADFVAILDADHVAGPDFLVNTLGYFADPKVAFVQTPQDFYNTDSFEHEHRKGWRRRSHTERDAYSEQALFYRVLQPGKNRWGAAFWCGTGAVVRMTALREVGGVATESVTEDIHTTIRMHKRGWHSVYHNEVLSRGLAAADAQQYQLQRRRWGTGAMQVLKSADNPLITPGLRFTQRVAYAATLVGWFDAWRTLGYLLLPPAVLLTGAVPIRANALTFLGFFSVTFVVQRAALRRLARGRAPHMLAAVFDVVRMNANIGATLTLFSRRSSGFVVTPKGRVGGDRRRQMPPLLLLFVAAVSLVAVVWFGLTMLGLTPLHYGVNWAAYGACGWLVVNSGLVAAAVRRIRDERFAGERRASVRFDVEVDGDLGGVPCTVDDLSLTGARVLVPGILAGEFEPGSAQDLLVGMPDPVRLRVVVRSRRETFGGVTVGVQFAADQAGPRAALALGLFQSQVVPDRVDEPTGTAPVVDVAV
jgi:cellulose synthase (UDP-forming)